jgi:hypothetical protein
MLPVVSDWVGFRRFENQWAIMAHLFLQAGVAVIPKGAGVLDRKLIGKCLTGLYAGKANSRHTIHLEWQEDAVPVNGGLLV